MKKYFILRYSLRIPSFSGIHDKKKNVPINVNTENKSQKTVPKEILTAGIIQAMDGNKSPLGRHNLPVIVSSEDLRKNGNTSDKKETHNGETSSQNKNGNSRKSTGKKSCHRKGKIEKRYNRENSPSDKHRSRSPIKPLKIRLDRKNNRKEYIVSESSNGSGECSDNSEENRCRSSRDICPKWILQVELDTSRSSRSHESSDFRRRNEIDDVIHTPSENHSVICRTPCLNEETPDNQANLQRIRNGTNSEKTQHLNGMQIQKAPSTLMRHLENENLEKNETYLESLLTLIKSSMQPELCAEMLGVLNYYYRNLIKYLQTNISVVYKEKIRKILDEVLVYMSSQFFGVSDKRELKEYTRKIMELDIRERKDFFHVHIRVLRKKCNDPLWMKRFINTLDQTNQSEYQTLIDAIDCQEKPSEPDAITTIKTAPKARIDSTRNPAMLNNNFNANTSSKALQQCPQFRQMNSLNPAANNATTASAKNGEQPFVVPSTVTNSVDDGVSLEATKVKRKYTKKKPTKCPSQDSAVMQNKGGYTNANKPPNSPYTNDHRLGVIRNISDGYNRYNLPFSACSSAGLLNRLQPATRWPYLRPIHGNNSMRLLNTPYQVSSDMSNVEDRNGTFSNLIAAQYNALIPFPRITVPQNAFPTRNRYMTDYIPAGIGTRKPPPSYTSFDTDVTKKTASQIVTRPTANKTISSVRSSAENSESQIPKQSMQHNIQNILSDRPSHPSSRYMDPKVGPQCRNEHSSSEKLNGVLNLNAIRTTPDNSKSISSDTRISYENPPQSDGNPLSESRFANVHPRPLVQNKSLIHHNPNERGIGLDPVNIISKPIFGAMALGEGQSRNAPNMDNAPRMTHSNPSSSRSHYSSSSSGAKNSVPMINANYQQLSTNKLVKHAPLDHTFVSKRIQPREVVGNNFAISSLIAHQQNPNSNVIQNKIPRSLSREVEPPHRTESSEITSNVSKTQNNFNDGIQDFSKRVIQAVASQSNVTAYSKDSVGNSDDYFTASTRSEQLKNDGVQDFVREVTETVPSRSNYTSHSKDSVGNSDDYSTASTRTEQANDLANEINTVEGDVREAHSIISLNPHHFEPNNEVAEKYQQENVTTASPLGSPQVICSPQSDREDEEIPTPPVIQNTHICTGSETRTRAVYDVQNASETYMIIDKNTEGKGKTINICTEKEKLSDITESSTEAYTETNIVDNVIVQDESMKITKDVPSHMKVDSEQQSDSVLVKRLKQDFCKSEDDKKVILEFYGGPSEFERMRKMVDTLKKICPDIYKKIRKETVTNIGDGNDGRISEVIIIEDDEDSGNVS